MTTRDAPSASGARAVPRPPRVDPSPAPGPTVFQSAFDRSPVGEYLLSPSAEHTILAVNDAFLRASSRRREELVGVSLFDAFPADPLDAQDTGVNALRASLARVVTEGRADRLPTQRYPIAVVDAAGVERYEERFWDALNTPVFDPDGRLVCISHRTEDVTEREQFQAALRRLADRQTYQLELADRLRSIVDPHEVVTAASEMLARRLAASRVSYCEIDDSRGTFALQHECIATGQPRLSGEVRRLDDFGPENMVLLSQGRLLVIDDVRTDPRMAAHREAYDQLGVRAVLAIPYLKGGRVPIVLAVHDAEPRHWTPADIEAATDTAERTWAAAESARSQAEMRAARDLNQSILDSMAEGFVRVDADWTVLQMNAEGLRIVDRTVDDVVGRDTWEAFPLMKDTPAEALLRGVASTRIAGTIDLNYRRPDDVSIWIELRAYPMSDGRLVVFFRDVGARKKLEHELRDMSRRKDDFLAMLAHELRNPLAPISAASQLIAAGALDAAQLKQTSEVIVRQSRHMTALLDDLLDVSRVTRGLVRIRRLPQDMKALVGSAVEQCRPLMESRRHHLAIDLSPEPARVSGDAKRLVQVLVNLLNNAAKYTPPGGNVVLGMRVEEAHVRAWVQDDGIGMSPELQERVFDLFTQADRTADRSQGGLGLGLALVRSLVALHGGTVTCRSEGPGRGSRFTVCLPRLVKRAEVPPPDVASGAAPGPGGPGLRVLVVDDNVDAADMLKLLLGMSGHEVAIEHLPSRAIERARRERPDVALLDIGLPEMDGLELARRLRAMPETANTVLIAVTGYGQDQDREKALASGFDRHLVKPVDIVLLEEILKPLRSG